MKKKPAAKSAFFNPRVLIGLAFCSIALLLTLLAFALYPGGNALAQGPGQDQASVQALVQENSPQETDAPDVIGTCDTAGPVEVEATAGTLGPTAYPNLAGAIAAINAGTHQGIIEVEICGNTTETAAMFLNSSGAGAASYTSVRIRPLADGLMISGPTLTGRGLIELNGADNITIDGDNPNSIGTNRNLTIQNTAANTVTYTSVIRIALNITDVTTANNVTIKNVNLLGSATGRNVSGATSTTGTESTTYGILTTANAAGATTAPTAISSTTTTIGGAATATNLTIQNNSFNTAARAIAVQGAAATVFPGLLIQNNAIGNSTAGAPDQVYCFGVTAAGSADGIIRANTVFVEGYVAGSGTSSTTGIDVGSIGTSGTMKVEKNMISRVRANNPGTYAAFGIDLGGGTNHVVQNNFVFDVRNDQTAGTVAFSTTFGTAGIRVGTGTGHKIYHNSVDLCGVLPGSTSTDLLAGLMVVTTASTGMDIRNNIFSNIMTGGNQVQTNVRFVAIYLPSSATVAMNLTLNNNDYVEGTDLNSRMAQVGTTAGSGQYLAADFDPTMTTPATNFRAYTSPLSAAGTNDNASKKVNPLFVSCTDLHIGFGSPMVDMGVDVGVTDDKDGDPRPNGAAPEIGADELPGGATPTATSTPTASPSATSTATATATIPPTPTPTPGCENYVISNASGAIVPGTTDIGNHTDDGITAIALPFPVMLYNQTYTTANAGSNGFLSFATSVNSFYTGCLPNASFTYTIFPFEIDQITSPAGYGIFTLLTGTAPNRTFYIEWRACRYSTATTCLANSDNNYEIVFDENNPGNFSIVYGTFGSANTIAGSGAIGVQGASGVVTQSQCGNGPPSATKQIYTQCLFGTPSPTPTATSTVPPSPTPTATATVPPTPTPSPTPCLNYIYSVGSGAIVPGVDDTGNHTDDASNVIALPFNYQLYDQTFSNVAVGSNGHLTFGTVNNAFNPGCIPIATATFAIFPYETDQCTVAGCVNNTGTGYGIFTSTSGTAPNRIFNIEYRTAYYNSGATAPTLNYEVRLFEGQTAFDVIYGTVPPTFTPPSARTLSVGVQRTNTTGYTLVGCDTTGGGSPPVSSGQLYHYTLGIICPSPTPTATATGTATATATASASPTPTATATATIPPATPTPPCPNPTKIFLQNFDGVTVPALPAGWTAANAIDPDAVLWVTSNSGAPTPSADSLPNAAFVNDPGDISDKRLDSPAIAIAGPAQLSFRNNYNLEASTTVGVGFDGGVLEISIGGGAFADIITAGGTFVSGGYNATISTQFSSPIAGRMAWSGNSGGFISTVVNLPTAANGQNINLRWRMASDDSLSKDGWRIDNVSMLDCLAAGTPTPTPTPTPGTINVSGNILLCNSTTGAAMQNVTLTMTGSNSGTTLTDASGNYTLSGVTNSGTTTVTPTKPQRAQGSAGINTTDAVAIQRHFLIIGTPLSGCHLTAADVNGVGGVNTVDAVAVQRFFLIQGTGTANVGKYVFNPLTRVYAMPLGGNQTGQNYTAVCLGDVVTPFVPGVP